MSLPSISQKLKAAISRDAKVMSPLEIAQKLFWATALFMLGLTLAACLLALSYPWGPLTVGLVAGIYWYKREYGRALPPQIIAAISARREAHAAGTGPRAAASKRSEKAARPVTRPTAGSIR